MRYVKVFNALPKKVQKLLESIAMREDIALEMRKGIDGRFNDEEDFPEISIAALQAMLAKAYLLGANSKSEQKK